MKCLSQTLWWILAGCLAAIALDPSSASTVPSLVVNGSSTQASANDGKALLEYVRDDSSEIELEQAQDAGFAAAQVRFRGTDSATVLTGLAEGSYFFRARAVTDDDAGAWSNVVELRVAYMGRGPLVALLVTGFVVVAMTAGAILTGRRNTEEPST